MKDRKKPSKEKISHFKIALSSWEVCKYSWTHIMPALLPYGQIRNNTGSSCAIYVTHSLLCISIWAKIQRKDSLGLFSSAYIHDAGTNSQSTLMWFPSFIVVHNGLSHSGKSKDLCFFFLQSNPLLLVCVCVRDKEFKVRQSSTPTYRMSMRCCLCALSLWKCAYIINYTSPNSI